MTRKELHLATERLSSLLRGSIRLVASAHGLKLVQLEALVYLSNANRYSDTPVAVTEYLGVTKGTVSQTLKTLERRALLRKNVDPADRRIQHCTLTKAGQSIVAEAFPAQLFEGANEETQSQLLEASNTLLSAMQRLNGFKTFGQCNTCRLYQPLPRGGRCGLTQELLSVIDAQKRCREHRPLLTLR